MTEQEKEVLGIYNLSRPGGSINPTNLHFVPHLGEIRLHDLITVEEILERIYDAGIYEGKRRGRIELANEFKSLLNIYTEDE